MIRPAVFLGALAVLIAAADPASADSRLEARYLVSLTGITIGQGALLIDITDEAYSAAGSAAVTGALKLIQPGKGSAAARGQFVDGKVVPADYSVSSESGKRIDDVHMALAGGMVREISVVPPPSKSSSRVPITDEHRKSVVDPMSAAIMPVAGNGDLTGPDACDRTLAIFDGRYRYDLVLRYERTETVNDVKGFAGPVAVCRVAYRPIAGHRPNRREVKQASANRNIFVWLAPVAGTRVLVPLRVTVGTWMGTLVVQATHFASEPRTRAAASPAAR